MRPTGSGDHIARPTWLPPRPRGNMRIPPCRRRQIEERKNGCGKGRLWGRRWSDPTTGVWGASGSGPSGGRAHVRQQRRSSGHRGWTPQRAEMVAEMVESPQRPEARRRAEASTAAWSAIDMRRWLCELSRL